MKRNTHVIVPSNRFVLETPRERLSTYRFARPLLYSRTPTVDTLLHSRAQLTRLLTFRYSRTTAEQHCAQFFI